MEDMVGAGEVAGTRVITKVIIKDQGYVSSIR